MSHPCQGTHYKSQTTLECIAHISLKTSLATGIGMHFQHQIEESTSLRMRLQLHFDLLLLFMLPLFDAQQSKAKHEVQYCLRKNTF